MVADPLESEELSPIAVEKLPSLIAFNDVEIAELLDEIAFSTTELEEVPNAADVLDGDELSPTIVEVTIDVARLLKSDELALFKVEEVADVAVVIADVKPSSPVFNEPLKMGELLEPSTPVVVCSSGRTVVREGDELSLKVRDEPTSVAEVL